MLDALTIETDNFTESAETPSGLRTSEIRYRRLFEAARDGIIILDAVTLQITDVNPFLTELLGYSREELLGKELWEIGLFSDKQASQNTFRQLQVKGYIRYEDLPLQTMMESFGKWSLLVTSMRKAAGRLFNANYLEFINQRNQVHSQGRPSASAAGAR